MIRHLALRSGAVACALTCAVAAHAAVPHGLSPRASRVAVVRAGVPRLAETPATIAGAVLASLQAAAVRDGAEPLAKARETTHNDPWVPAAFVFQSTSDKFLAIVTPHPSGAHGAPAPAGS